jgi:hypothetical protein
VKAVARNGPQRQAGRQESQPSDESVSLEIIGAVGIDGFVPRGVRLHSSSLEGAHRMRLWLVQHGIATLGIPA